MLPTRFWEISAGTFLACIDQKSFKLGYKLESILPWMGIALISISMIIFDESMQHPSLLTFIFPILGTMLVIHFAKGSPFFVNFLGSRVFLGIGLVSYGFYLWHFPVFTFARVIEFFDNKWAKLTCIVASLILSIVTYFFIESPARDKKKISFKMLTSFLAIGVFILVLVSVVIKKRMVSLKG